MPTPKGDNSSMNATEMDPLGMIEITWNSYVGSEGMIVTSFTHKIFPEHNAVKKTHK